MSNLPKTAEEVRARVAIALKKFENQPRWRQRKAAMTDRDYAQSYLKKEVRAAYREIEKKRVG